MRGNSIHAALITDSRQSQRVSFDDIIDKHCHVGPPMKEIKAMTVPGFAHVLQTRILTDQPITYVKNRVYLPPCTANILGEQANPALQQCHRKTSRQRIEIPVETSAMQNRGGHFQKWTAMARQHAREKQGGLCYPDSYIEAVQAHNQQAESIM